MYTKLIYLYSDKDSTEYCYWQLHQTKSQYEGNEDENENDEDEKNYKNMKDKTKSADEGEGENNEVDEYENLSDA